MGLGRGTVAVDARRTADMVRRCALKRRPLRHATHCAVRVHRVPWLVLAIVSLAMFYKLSCRYCGASAQAAQKSKLSESVNKHEIGAKENMIKKELPPPAVVGPESKGGRWAWRRSRLNDTGPLLMVAVGLVQLLFLVLNATDSGKQWFKEAVQNRVTYKLRMAELDDFTADLCARLRLPPHIPTLLVSRDEDRP